MNRHQRRAALKARETRAGTAPPAEERTPPPSQNSPGLALRIAAAMLLSPWMLRRVRNAEVLGMLREVARQAGRDTVVRQIDDRINMVR